MSHPIPGTEPGAPLPITPERMEELALDYAAGKNACSAAGALAHCADDFVFDVATEPVAHVVGKAAVATHLEALWAAFPDLYSRVDRQVVGPTGLVAIGALSGTMRGPFLGLPPTGRSFEVSLVSAFEYTGDRIAHETNCVDMLALLAQLELPADAVAQVIAGLRGDFA